ncbi:MAG: caspase family protein [Reichenbachiella sp.]
MTRILLLLCAILTLQYTQAQQLTIDNQGHAGLIHGLEFIEGGKKLISVSDDKTVRVWDVVTGSLNKTYRFEQEAGAKGKIYASALSTNEQYLFLGGYFGNKGDDGYLIGRIKVLDLRKEEIVATLQGHENVVLDLAISNDGNTLTSTSADKSVLVWDISSVRNVKQITAINGLDEIIHTLAISPDGNIIAGGDGNGYIKTWDITDGQLETSKARVHLEAIRDLAYTNNGEKLYSASDDGKVIKWTKNGKFLGEVSQHAGPINTIQISADDQYLLAMSRRGYVYDLNSETQLRTFNMHSNVVSTISNAPFSQFNGTTGTYVASAGGNEKNILLWNLKTGDVERNLVGKGKSIFSVGINEENAAIAFGQSNPTGNLDDVQYEKSFSLNDILLDLNQPSNQNYHKAEKESAGGIISKQSSNELSVNGQLISTDPRADGTIRSFSFINNEEAFVIGSTFTLNKYRSSGEKLGSFKGHLGEIWSVVEYQKEDLLITGSSDQTIRIWNNITGENLLNLFISTENEWVIWTPQGFYEASAGGEKHIGWHINKGDDKLAEYQDVSAFSNYYHRADVIKKILELKSFEAVASLIQLTEKPQEKISPPIITWDSPLENNISVNGNTIEVRFFITSATPVTQIKLMANGRPLISKNDISVSGNKNPELVTLQLELPEETNETYAFSVFAMDANSKVKSTDRIVTFINPIEETEPILDHTSITEVARASPSETSNYNPALVLDPVNDKQKKGNLYMISIGVSEFSDTRNNLNFAANDAESMADMFQAQEGKMFNSVKTIKILNEEATRLKILSTFQNLEKYTTVDDFVIIFIATHGLNENNQFYIIPHDGDALNPRITCIDWRDFSDLVGNMSAKVLLFIDTCHSGQLGNNIGQKAKSNTEAVRELSGQEFGVVIMAAATGDEFSLEHPDWEHGAFTYSILEGIQQGKADIKPDGIIHLRELDYYLAERVRELTGGRQHPTTQKPSSISRLRIAEIE